METKLRHDRRLTAIANRVTKRLMSYVTTYPSGQALDIQYGIADSADDHFNRVTALQLTTDESPLVQYTYLGLAKQVLVDYPQPAVELTYELQGSEPVGDAGDPYNGYDRFARTVDIRWQSTTEDTQLERLLYGYDRNSRRTWRMSALTTNEDNAYAYDALSQVTNAALGNLNTNATAIGGVPVTNETWDYDPTGNWKDYQVAEDGTVSLDQTRAYDKGNRLTQIVGDPNPVTLDQAGRMLELPPDATGYWSNSQQITWDAWSRVIQVTNVGDATVVGAYAYDGLSRRITRIANGITLDCYYSRAWKPLEERQNGETTPAIQYYWGARHRDDLVRRDRATTEGGSLDETRYVLSDYFSPAALTDGSGNVTERYGFSAFGVRRIMAPDWSPVSVSECDFEFAFQGQFLDTETGFMDYGYRYYSPYLGRWLCKDPIMEKGGANLYAADGNNTVNKVDYLGRQSACPDNAFGAPADPKNPTDPTDPNNPNNNGNDDGAPSAIIINPKQADGDDGGSSGVDTDFTNPDGGGGGDFGSDYDPNLPPGAITIGNPSGRAQIGDPIGGITLNPSQSGTQDDGATPNLSYQPIPGTDQNTGQVSEDAEQIINLADGTSLTFDAGESIAAFAAGDVLLGASTLGVGLGASLAIEGMIAADNAITPALGGALNQATYNQAISDPNVPTFNAATDAANNANAGMGDPNLYFFNNPANF
jgi:RHS repeat-associated protein